MTGHWGWNPLGTNKKSQLMQLSLRGERSHSTALQKWSPPPRKGSRIACCSRSDIRQFSDTVLIRFRKPKQQKGTFEELTLILNKWSWRFTTKCRQCCLSQINIFQLWPQRWKRSCYLNLAVFSALSRLKYLENFFKVSYSKYSSLETIALKPLCFVSRQFEPQNSFTAFT